VYYGWEETIKIVRELQPNAVIFSDAGPDVRWVGNEHGHAKDSCWATYTPVPAKGYTKAYAGTCKYQIGETGTMNGKYWMPAETDVSIRPGWFYHKHEDNKVKSLDELLDIYFHSVGNGTSLNLNIPPDRKGQIHKTDSIRLMEFKAYLDKAFSNDLLAGSRAEASNVRGKDFEPRNLTDNDQETYWATEDGVKTATIEFSLKKDVIVNSVMLQEYIQLGQRVTQFSIEANTDGKWKEVAKGSTIGHKKIVRFDKYTTGKLRLKINGALACPVISGVAAFNIK
jgi:alpha-L-fucosidase